MTILQAHNITNNLNTQLRNQFAEQLAAIHPDANICYQSHYDKFTVTVYTSVHEASDEICSTEHLAILSNLSNSPAMEVLAHSLTRHILEEQSCNATELLKTKTQMATEDN